MLETASFLALNHISSIIIPSRNWVPRCRDGDNCDSTFIFWTQARLRSHRKYQVKVSLGGSAREEVWGHSHWLQQGLNVPTIQPAFIEWQSTIGRSPPSSQNLGIKRKKQPPRWLSEPARKHFNQQVLSQDICYRFKGKTLEWNETMEFLIQQAVGMCVLSSLACQIFLYLSMGNREARWFSSLYQQSLKMFTGPPTKLLELLYASFK